MFLLQKIIRAKIKKFFSLHANCNAKKKIMVQTCVVLTAIVCLALAAGTASASTDIPLTNGTVYYSSSTNLYSYVAGRVDPSGTLSLCSRCPAFPAAVQAGSSRFTAAAAAWAVALCKYG